MDRASGFAAGGLEPFGGFAAWSDRLDLVRCRRGLPRDAPALTILLGPTGSGKSTIFNTVLGRAISPPGAIRPTTSRPVMVAEPASLAFFREDSFLSRSELDVDFVPLAAGDPERPHQALMDTPDFDGVDPENRRRAERLLLRADRVVLLLNPEKYADRSVWSVIDTLLPLANLAGCLFNKNEGSAARRDCEDLLRERGVERLIAIPRIAGAAEVLDLPPELRADLAELTLADRGKGAWARLSRAVETQERAFRTERIEPWVTAVSTATAKLRTSLARTEESLPRHVAERLPLKLDEALRRELVAKFSAEIERIDILREPRRWVADTWRWVRNSVPFLRAEKSQTSAVRASAAEWLATAYRDRYRELLYELSAGLKLECERAAPAVEMGFPWPRFAAPDPDVIEARLRSVFEDLEKEIVEESHRIADGLPILSKLGFFGSQVAIHAVMLVLFVKTGGLTGGEVMLQGLSSPILARVVGLLISGGEATALERRLGQFFRDRVAATLRPLLEPLRKSLHAIEQAVPSPSEWQAATRAWDHGRPRSTDR